MTTAREERTQALLARSRAESEVKFLKERNQALDRSKEAYAQEILGHSNRNAALTARINQLESQVAERFQEKLTAQEKERLLVEEAARLSAARDFAEAQQKQFEKDLMEVKSDKLQQQNFHSKMTLVKDEEIKRAADEIHRLAGELQRREKEWLESRTELRSEREKLEELRLTSNHKLMQSQQREHQLEEQLASTREENIKLAGDSSKYKEQATLLQVCAFLNPLFPFRWAPEQVN